MDKRISKTLSISIPSACIVLAAAIVSIVLSNIYFSPAEIFKRHTIINPPKTFNTGKTEISDEYKTSLTNFCALCFESSLKVTKDNNCPNTLVSPFSLYTNLVSLYSITAGETNSEIIQSLNIRDKEEGLKIVKETNLEINNLLIDEFKENDSYLSSNIINTLFINNSLSGKIGKNSINAFSETYTDVFYSNNSKDIKTIVSESFTKQSNGFLKLKYGDQIKENNALIFYNAHYFESSWSTKVFEIQKHMDFYNNGNKQIKKTFLSFNYCDANYYSDVYEDANMLVFSIPLKNNLNLNIQMAKEKTDAKKVLNEINFLLNKRDYETSNNRILVELPKFSHESLTTKKLLDTMGMPSLFHNAEVILDNDSIQNATCDFYNQTLLDFNSNGIAVSNRKANDYICPDGSSTTKPLVITVNHPFNYSITFDDIPIFMGQIMEL